MIPRASLLIWAVLVGYFDSILPTRAIIASPFLSFLGGDCLFNSITYALAGSLSNDHATRASYFAYMSSINYAVALLGPSLASATMSLLLWLPFWIGLLLLAGATTVIHRLPDGIHDDRHENQRVDAEEEANPLLENETVPRRHVTNSSLSKHGTIFAMSKSKILEILSLLLARRNLSLLFFAMVLTSTASSDTKLLPQYISKRYHWKFSSAGYLISLKAVVNFTLLTLIIPAIIRHYSGKSKSQRGTIKFNIIASQILLALSVLGAFAIAWSLTISMLIPSMFIYALGSALPVFKLSLLVAFSSSSHNTPSSPSPLPRVGTSSPSLAPISTLRSRSRSRSPGPEDNQPDPNVLLPPDSRDEDEDDKTFLFSVAMLLKTVGSLLGAPLVAALWVRGIQLGGAALGLPFFISSGLYLVAMGVMALFRY
jgi:MFS family permease